MSLVSAVSASRGVKSCFSGRNLFLHLTLGWLCPAPHYNPLRLGPGDKAMTHACEVGPWGGGEWQTFASDFNAVSSSGEGEGNFQKTLECISLVLANWAFESHLPHGLAREIFSLSPSAFC